MDKKERARITAQLAEVAVKVYDKGHHQDCAMSGDSGWFCDCGYEIAARLAEDAEYGTVGELVGE